MIEPIPSAQMRLRRKVDEPTHRLALRAILTAAHLLGLAVGAHLRALRAAHDPLATLQARIQEAELRATLAWEIVELQNGRFSRLAEKKRLISRLPSDSVSPRSRTSLAGAPPKRPRPFSSVQTRS